MLLKKLFNGWNLSDASRLLTWHHEKMMCDALHEGIHTTTTCAGNEIHLAYNGVSAKKIAVFQL